MVLFDSAYSVTKISCLTSRRTSSYSNDLIELTQVLAIDQDMKSLNDGMIATRSELKMTGKVEQLFIRCCKALEAREEVDGKADDSPFVAAYKDGGKSRIEARGLSRHHHRSWSVRLIDQGAAEEAKPGRQIDQYKAQVA